MKICPYSFNVLQPAQAAGADTAADAAVLKTDYIQLMNAIVAFVHDNRDL